MLKNILKFIMGLGFIWIYSKFAIDVDEAISSLEHGSFIDERDNQEYQVIKLNEVKWMIQNLNYKTKEGSLCYDNLNSNCDNLGQLYTYEAVLKACPEGWRLPSVGEWQTLTKSLNECSIDMNSSQINSGLRKKIPPYQPQEGGYYNNITTGSPTFYGKGSSGYFWIEHGGVVNLLAGRCGYKQLDGKLSSEAIERGRKPNYYSCRCVQEVEIDTSDIDSF